jgi:hypothetical protein
LAADYRRLRSRRQVEARLVERQPQVHAVSSAAGARGDAAAAPAAAAGRGRRAAGPPPPADAQVLKFSKDGKFLCRLARAEDRRQRQHDRLQPAGRADGRRRRAVRRRWFGNHRIAVFDANTGTFKRSWGAYGEKPTDTDPARTIRTARRRSSSARSAA